jgi:hypothetical protein
LCLVAGGDGVILRGRHVENSASNHPQGTMPGGPKKIFAIASPGG